MLGNGLEKNIAALDPDFIWIGDESSIISDPEKIKALLLDLDKPCYIIQNSNTIAVSCSGSIQTSASSKGYSCYGVIPPFKANQLGANSFCADYGLKYPYMGGAMANGISSEDMVIALGKSGFIGSFGTGGLSIKRIEQAILKIQSGLPNGPYAFNLLHNPSQPQVEWDTVQMYINYGVKVLEASAFLKMVPSIVYYRAAGLKRNSDGGIEINNRIIAKVSRPEVAQQFLEPAPKKILDDLLAKGLITPQQAELMQTLPVADDITVEGDSGGHTDNGVLSCIFSAIIKSRDEMQDKYQYKQPVRIGAGGGICTPQSALAAFTMGASYIVTGSINQATVEAGTSDNVKKLLEKAEINDVMMAPAADMFEMGAKVQVLKRGSFFPLKAQRMYELYKTYNSIEDIPQEEKEKLEDKYFKQPMEDIWKQTVKFFNDRGFPQIIQKAEADPKTKMALVFRWYLGQTSSWAINAAQGREADYQIWCGAALGAFNKWIKGSQLEAVGNRKVGDIASIIMDGTAYLSRIHFMKGLNIAVDPYYENIKPSDVYRN